MNAKKISTHSPGRGHSRLAEFENEMILMTKNGKTAKAIYDWLVNDRLVSITYANVAKYIFRRRMSWGSSGPTAVIASFVGLPLPEQKSVYATLGMILQNNVEASEKLARALADKTSNGRKKRQKKKETPPPDTTPPPQTEERQSNQISPATDVPDGLLDVKPDDPPEVKKAKRFFSLRSDQLYENIDLDNPLLGENKETGGKTDTAETT